MVRRGREPDCTWGSDIALALFPPPSPSASSFSSQGHSSPQLGQRPLLSPLRHIHPPSSWSHSATGPGAPPQRHPGHARGVVTCGALQASCVVSLPHASPLRPGLCLGPYPGHCPWPCCCLLIWWGEAQDSEHADWPVTGAIKSFTCIPLLNPNNLLGR